MLDWIDLTLRLLAGVGLGAMIGLERQWRSRMAGLRTNALVSLGAALFVILGAYSLLGPTADPTRVAAQIVSGIGFLGAGVIWKQGATVTGLNTAATLWTSAAIGALAGSGLVWAASIGTVIVIGANLILRPVGRILDRRTTSRHIETSGAEYTFEVRCARSHEVTIRALVFGAVHKPELTVLSIGAADIPEDIVLVTAIVRSEARNDHEIELAIAALIDVPEVLAVRWSAADLAAID